MTTPKKSAKKSVKPRAKAAKPELEAAPATEAPVTEIPEIEAEIPAPDEA